MRRLALVALAALFALSVPVAWAQNPTPTPARTATPVPQGTIISLPANNETVRGRVRIFGSAWVEDFQRYEVFRIEGSQQIYMAGGTQPVVNGLIYEWNTAGFKDGVYGLMVRAVRKDGNYKEARISVRLDNSTPPTPTASPTEAVTATPEPTRTQMPLITTPTVLRSPTPTPASVATPSQGLFQGLFAGLSLPSLDPMVCVRPLAVGAVLAGGYFLLFGLLAIIKRLLGG